MNKKVHLVFSDNWQMMRVFQTHLRAQVWLGPQTPLPRPTGLLQQSDSRQRIEGRRQAGLVCVLLFVFLFLECWLNFVSSSEISLSVCKCLSLLLYSLSLSPSLYLCLSLSFCLSCLPLSVSPSFFLSLALSFPLVLFLSLSLMHGCVRVHS